MGTTITCNTGTSGHTVTESFHVAMMPDGPKVMPHFILLSALQIMVTNTLGGGPADGGTSQSLLFCCLNSTLSRVHDPMLSSCLYHCPHNSQQQHPGLCDPSVWQYEKHHHHLGILCGTSPFLHMGWCPTLPHGAVWGTLVMEDFPAADYAAETLAIEYVVHLGWVVTRAVSDQMRVSLPEPAITDTETISYGEFKNSISFLVTDTEACHGHCWTHQKPQI